MALLDVRVLDRNLDIVGQRDTTLTRHGAARHLDGGFPVFHDLGDRGEILLVLVEPVDCTRRTSRPRE